MRHNILRISARIQANADIADLEQQADEAWMRQDFEAADRFAALAHDKRKEQH